MFPDNDEPPEAASIIHWFIHSQLDDLKWPGITLSHSGPSLYLIFLQCHIVIYVLQELWRGWLQCAQLRYKWTPESVAGFWHVEFICLQTFSNITSLLWWKSLTFMCYPLQPWYELLKSFIAAGASRMLTSTSSTKATSPLLLASFAALPHLASLHAF